MEHIVTNVNGIKFTVETQLEEQIGLGELPFSKMNKSGVGVCHFYMNNICTMGPRCPLRHIKGDRTVVCKHWLRGLCKKGDDCEFLHEYDMNKMPECYFFSKYGECQNKECPFLHIDPSSKIQDCCWYDRGFCRNGPHCKNRHVRRVACKNYINGFCPEGKDCKFAHSKWWPLPGYDHQDQHKQRWICHHCMADIHNFKFIVETQFEEQIGLGELPFIKMDKSRAGVCQLFLENNCILGDRCPLRHIKGHRTIVCKHYLNGLCKKGDECEYLHEYNMNKMPECYFYSKFGECQNSECMYTHTKFQIKNCPWYDRGFCRNGPNCNFTHERKIACKNYINGFCVDGPDCKFSHPKWWPLPGNDQQDQHRQRWVCHNCHQPGHKIQFCLKLPVDVRQKLQEEMQAKYKVNGDYYGVYRPGRSGQLKPLEEITCFKCGEKGHYANRCNKSYLAFLSKSGSSNISNSDKKLTNQTKSID